MKVMIGLVRRDDMSHEEFAHWWTQEHAPLARTLPGVRRIRFNLLEEGAPFDGIAELWFDSAEAAHVHHGLELPKPEAQAQDPKPGQPQLPRRKEGGRPDGR